MGQGGDWEGLITGFSFWFLYTCVCVRGWIDLYKKISFSQKKQILSLCGIHTLDLNHLFT